MQQEIEARLQHFRAEFGALMVAQICQAFAGDAPLRLARIGVKLADNDAAGLITEAHGLKGSCHNIGARSVGEMCALLEEYGRVGALDGARVIYAQVSRELQEVLRYLQNAPALKSQTT
jgi:HPt (histidine-containing phosphotransfer) domain-containing protein